MGAQVTRLEAADGELAAEDRAAESEVRAVEEIQAAVAPVAFAAGLGDLLQLAQPRLRVVDGRQEVEVAGGPPRPARLEVDERALHRVTALLFLRYQSSMPLILIPAADLHEVETGETKGAGFSGGAG